MKIATIFVITLLAAVHAFDETADEQDTKEYLLSILRNGPVLDSYVDCLLEVAPCSPGQLHFKRKRMLDIQNFFIMIH